MRKDLEAAVALVRSGMSYGEAAAALGLTRKQVSGACMRANFRVSPEHRARIDNASAARLREMRKDPAFNAKRLEAIRRQKNHALNWNTNTGTE
jgi:Helix-turn-helix domain